MGRLPHECDPVGAGEVPATALEPHIGLTFLFFLTQNHLEIDAKEFIMKRETSSSTRSVHNYYEHFINSYKTFVVSFLPTLHRFEQD